MNKLILLMMIIDVVFAFMLVAVLLTNADRSTTILAAILVVLFLANAFLLSFGINKAVEG